MCSKENRRFKFKRVTGINESKILTKYASCECKCKFDGRKFDSNQKWNDVKRRCECKKHHICEKDYIWNPATCSCENSKYLANIIDDSVIMCDEIIEVDAEAKLNDEETKTTPKHFNEKKQPLKHLVSVFYLHFINYYNIIDIVSYYYLLLPVKMSH